MKQDSLPDLRSLNCCRLSSHYCWHATWPWAIELLQDQQSLLLACNMTLGHWMNCCRFSSHYCWHEIWPWVIEWTVTGLAVTVVGMKHDLGLLNELLQVQQSLLLAWNMTLGYWMNCCRFSSHCWHETWPWVIELSQVQQSFLLAWNMTWCWHETRPEVTEWTVAGGQKTGEQQAQHGCSGQPVTNPVCWQPSIVNYRCLGQQLCHLRAQKAAYVDMVHISGALLNISMCQTGNCRLGIPQDTCWHGTCSWNRFQRSVCCMCDVKKK